MFVKRTLDPDSTRRLTFDWEDFLTKEDDTIDSVTWVVPTGLVKVNEQKTNYLAKIWVSLDSSGVSGEDYNLTCRVTTVGESVLGTPEPQILDKTVTIRVRPQ